MYHDAEHIEPLTLDEMKDFYARYISRDSTKRAKISVHLHARASSNTTDLTPAEQQRSHLLGLVSKMLSHFGVTADAQQLEPRFKDVEFAADDAPKVVEAIRTYLMRDEALAEEKVEKIIPKITKAIQSSAADLAAMRADANGVARKEDGQPQPKEPVFITDVYRWKTGLMAGRGPQPVKDLTEFEDLEAKL